MKKSTILMLFVVVALSFPRLSFAYTVNQLIRPERNAIPSKVKSPALEACPQRRGVCTRVYTTQEPLGASKLCIFFLNSHFCNLV